MAKGYPDFYGFSVFSKIGPVIDDTVAPLAVPTDVLTTIHNITGKGQIMGGHLRGADALDDVTTRLVLTIDGDTAIDQTIFRLYYAFAYYQDCGPIYITGINTRTHMIAIAFSRGITFEQSYHFQLFHSEGFARNIYSSIFYTRIL